METLTLAIGGMACAGCANSVSAALQALPGVLAVRVSHEQAMAAIEYDPGKVSVEQMKAAVRAAGYAAAD